MGERIWEGDGAPVTLGKTLPDLGADMDRQRAIYREGNLGYGGYSQGICPFLCRM